MRNTHKKNIAEVPHTQGGEYLCPYLRGQLHHDDVVTSLTLVIVKLRVRVRVKVKVKSQKSKVKTRP